MQYFNIQVASQLSGVTSATIRAWEKRYNAVTPDRAQNKHRLYSGEDIEKLTLLSRLTEIGQSIGKIAHLDLAKLKEIYLTLMQRPYEEVQFPLRSEFLEFNEQMQNIKRALIAKKFNIIGHELEKALMASGPRDVCLTLLIPILKEIKSLPQSQIEIVKNLIHFFIGKLVWNFVDHPDSQEKVIIYYNRANDILPLITAVILMANNRTPYFITNSDSTFDLLDLIKDVQPSTIYSDLKMDFDLSFKYVMIPSELDSFLSFLKAEEEALQQSRPLF